jgi:hypothetical protein
MKRSWNGMPHYISMNLMPAALWGRPETDKELKQFMR